MKEGRTMGGGVEVIPSASFPPFVSFPCISPDVDRGWSGDEVG